MKEFTKQTLTVILEKLNLRVLFSFIHIFKRHIRISVPLSSNLISNHLLALFLLKTQMPSLQASHSPLIWLLLEFEGTCPHFFLE